MAWPGLVAAAAAAASAVPVVPERALSSSAPPESRDLTLLVGPVLSHSRQPRLRRFARATRPRRRHPDLPSRPPVPRPRPRSRPLGARVCPVDINRSEPSPVVL
ncbi:hypothetical protein ACCO45_014013 [Purpureocillium lilacinum]|uniref:Uncharacterized protein n=1 Tax=Purpureocillium lilacinum TaxID=33203 RepID=A0ACC4D7U8_PURLI